MRRRRISCWSILPLLMTTIGLPQIARRNFVLLSIQIEARISQTIKIPIGKSPLTSGWPLSCMGMAAISEINSVTTSSLVCNSLICRFPIKRTAIIMTT